MGNLIKLTGGLNDNREFHKKNRNYQSDNGWKYITWG